MKNSSFKERLKHLKIINGKKVLLPIKFSIKSSKLIQIINMKKKDLRNSLKELKKI